MRNMKARMVVEEIGEGADKYYLYGYDTDIEKFKELRTTIDHHVCGETLGWLTFRFDASCLRFGYMNMNGKKIWCVASSQKVLEAIMGVVDAMTSLSPAGVEQ